jgi:hypothetical protein
MGGACGGIDPCCTGGMDAEGTGAMDTNPDASRVGTGCGSVLAMLWWDRAGGGGMNGGRNAPDPVDGIECEPDPGAGGVRRAAAAIALPVVRTDGDVTVGSGPTTEPLDGGNIGVEDPGAPGGAGVDILRSTSFRARCGGMPESELDMLVCPLPGRAAGNWRSCFPSLLFFLHNQCATQGRR